MVQRVFLSKSPPRLITSKAGKSATPTMADANKSFDSNWFNGGGLKWILKKSNSAFTPFPYPLNYIPYVWVFGAEIWNGEQEYFSKFSINTKVVDMPPAGSSMYIFPVSTGKDDYVTTSGIFNVSFGGGDKYRYLVMEG